MFKLRPQQISSYVMNRAVCDYGQGTSSTVKLSQMSPAGVAFWECDDATTNDNTGLFNDGASRPDENTSGRHDTVTPAAIFDGSARIMQIADWMEKMEEDGPNELWCAPDSPDGQ